MPYIYLGKWRVVRDEQEIRGQSETHNATDTARLPKTHDALARMETARRAMAHGTRVRMVRLDGSIKKRRWANSMIDIDIAQTLKIGSIIHSDSQKDGYNSACEWYRIRGPITYFKRENKIFIPITCATLCRCFAREDPQIRANHTIREFSLHQFHLPPDDRCQYWIDEWEELYPKVLKRYGSDEAIEENHEEFLDRMERQAHHMGLPSDRELINGDFNHLPYSDGVDRISRTRLG
tara:strand:- start:13981 stop:14688 length:708 start_codon:yes stop_codon:yes gene_type:complete